jgi:hypothetical protein
MPTKIMLMHKILAHIDRKDRAERRQAQQIKLFETSAPELYSMLGEMLIDVPGIELSTEATSALEPTSCIETLCVKMLDKVVKFIPVQRNEVRGLDVSGLFDRALFFIPDESGDWEADDQRNDTTILLSEKLIFTRLAALVPE